MHIPEFQKNMVKKFGITEKTMFYRNIHITDILIIGGKFFLKPHSWARDSNTCPYVNIDEACEKHTLYFFRDSLSWEYGCRNTKVSVSIQDIVTTCYIIESATGTYISPIKDGELIPVTLHSTKIKLDLSEISILYKDFYETAETLNVNIYHLYVRFFNNDDRYGPFSISCYTKNPEVQKIIYFEISDSTLSVLSRDATEIKFTLLCVLFEVKPEYTINFIKSGRRIIPWRNYLQSSGGFSIKKYFIGLFAK